MTASGAIGEAFYKDPERRALYLRVLEETGEKTLARHEAGVSVKVISWLRGKDPEFHDAEHEALRMYRAKHIASEIHRRAVVGTVREIYYNGVVVGHERVYSDALLKFHAQRHIAEYRDRLRVDQNTTTKHVVSLEQIEASLSPESRADLRRILEREAARAEESSPE